jgi:hypothetical protein
MMPEQFDPRWEFFQADPEVLEVLDMTTKASSLELLGVYDSYRPQERAGIAKKDMVSGFRLGHGNPDRQSSFRLGRSKKPVGSEPKLTDKVCQGCGKVFLPDRSSRRYCSMDCRPFMGRTKEIPDRTCPTCGVVFSTDRKSQRYCSRVCYGASCRKSK